MFSQSWLKESERGKNKHFSTPLSFLLHSSTFSYVLENHQHCLDNLLQSGPSLNLWRLEGTLPTLPSLWSFQDKSKPDDNLSAQDRGRLLLRVFMRKRQLWVVVEVVAKGCNNFHWCSPALLAHVTMLMLFLRRWLIIASCSLRPKASFLIALLNRARVGHAHVNFNQEKSYGALIDQLASFWTFIKGDSDNESTFLDSITPVLSNKMSDIWFECLNCRQIIFPPCINNCEKQVLWNDVLQ